MSTEKEPDYAGIAQRLTTSHYQCDWPMRYVRKEVEGFASCMEARLRSDWETIRLLRTLPHTEDCSVHGEWKQGNNPAIMYLETGTCTCGLSSQLSKLLEPFTP